MLCCLLEILENLTIVKILTLSWFNMTPLGGPVVPDWREESKLSISKKKTLKKLFKPLKTINSCIGLCDRRGKGQRSYARSQPQPVETNNFKMAFECDL